MHKKIAVNSRSRVCRVGMHRPPHISVTQCLSAINIRTFGYGISGFVLGTGCLSSAKEHLYTKCWGKSTWCLCSLPQSLPVLCPPKWASDYSIISVLFICLARWYSMPCRSPTSPQNRKHIKAQKSHVRFIHWRYFNSRFFCLSAGRSLHILLFA